MLTISKNKKIMVNINIDNIILDWFGCGSVVSKSILNY